MSGSREVACQRHGVGAEIDVRVPINYRIRGALDACIAVIGTVLRKRAFNQSPCLSTTMVDTTGPPAGVLKAAVWSWRRNLLGRIQNHLGRSNGLAQRLGCVRPRRYLEPSPELSQRPCPTSVGAPLRIVLCRSRGASPRSNRRPAWLRPERDVPGRLAVRVHVPALAEQDQISSWHARH